MKHVACIGISFLLGAACAAAQNTAQPAVSFGVAGMGQLSADRQNYSPSDASDFTEGMCPVRMRALQGTGQGLLAVRDTPRVEGPSQTIHLILVNPQSKKYAGAKVAIRGLAPKGKIVNAAPGSTGPSSAGPAEIIKTLDVTFSPEDDKSVVADLVLPGFSAVTFVQLKSVTYQDGSSWKLDEQVAGMCRVAPDPLMLIANQ